jgi:hypothetical protein
MEKSIYFTQMSMYRWRAFVNVPSGRRKTTTVADIVQKTGDVGESGKYVITYFAMPAMHGRGPAKTTRSVTTDLDTIQKRILKRGWT